MAPDKLNQVLNTHSQVFEEGLGTLNNVKVNLAIDPSVPPKFHKARSIPFPLKEKVELELQRLEELGTYHITCYSFRIGSPHCACYETKR